MRAHTICGMSRGVSYGRDLDLSTHNPIMARIVLVI